MFLLIDIKDDDVYWCGADIGWVTGHSYIVYGPLANGVTGVMYEGTPDTPGKDRLWQIIEDYKVTIFYTAPTAIRAFMKWGDEYPAMHDLSSLRLLGTVGEPINPEAWMWYNEHIGGGNCPIVDTWWQTETGAIMITPLPGAVATKPVTVSPSNRCSGPTSAGLQRSMTATACGSLSRVMKWCICALQAMRRSCAVTTRPPPRSGRRR